MPARPPWQSWEEEEATPGRDIASHSVRHDVTVSRVCRYATMYVGSSNLEMLSELFSIVVVVLESC